MLPVVLLFVLLPLCRGDYDCLCSYNIESPVYNSASRSASIIGYLYEFDCKAYLQTGGTDPKTWAPIAYKKQLGFVEIDQQIKTQVCPGDPSVADMLPALQSSARPNIQTTQPKRITSVNRISVKQTNSPQTPTTYSYSRSESSTATSVIQSTEAPTTSGSLLMNNVLLGLPTTPKPATSQAVTTYSISSKLMTRLTSNSYSNNLPSSTGSSRQSSSGLFGDPSVCPLTQIQFAQKYGDILAQYGDSCYTVVNFKAAWEHAEYICQRHGGHLLHIANEKENNFIYNLLDTQFSHSVWIGLHDIGHEEHFKWTSGDPVTYTNWLPGRKDNHDSHYEEDCVEFIPYRNHGAWDDLPCADYPDDDHDKDWGFTKYFICEHATTAQPATKPSSQMTQTAMMIQANTTVAPMQQSSTTQSSTATMTARMDSSLSALSTQPSTVKNRTVLALTTSKPSSTQGDTSLCPLAQIQYAKKYGDILAQYGDSCYTIVNVKAAWEHAEDICQSHGGHLLHIANEQENNFIYNLLDSQFSHSVWIGLHDIGHEEHFKWTSGDPVTYTNWLPGRKNNHDSHYEEDCVEFIPYRNHGAWDDLPCGDYPDDDHDKDWGFTKYFICEHKIIKPMTTIQTTNLDTTTPVITTMKPDSTTAVLTTMKPDTTTAVVSTMKPANIAPCSASIQYNAKIEGGVLTDNGQKCYELVKQNVTWDHSEKHCNQYGGHLLQISDQSEQDFIQNFLNLQDPTQAVWIGLHDQNQEDTFIWTSGEPVTYANWMAGRLDDVVNKDIEDCVVFMPYNQGKWNDVPCGYWDTGEFIPGSSGFVSHYFICEYGAVAGGGSVLVGK